MRMGAGYAGKVFRYDDECNGNADDTDRTDKSGWGHNRIRAHLPDLRHPRSHEKAVTDEREYAGAGKARQIVHARPEPRRERVI